MTQKTNRYGIYEVDHTKFGGGSLFTVCEMKDIKRIITDSAVSAEIIELAGRMKIRLDAV